MTRSGEGNAPAVDWLREAAVAITVCDLGGKIVEMNRESARVFAKYGGEKLLGRNLLDCHHGAARIKLEDLLKNPRSNTYMVRSKGRCRLIHQFPWIRDGRPAGLVELGVTLPDPVPEKSANPDDY